MSNVTPTAAGLAPSAVLPSLAGQEIRRYLRHPLFWVGVVLTAASCVSGPDPLSSSLLHVIAPAAGLGLFGLIIMSSLTRNSDRAAAAAGGVSVPERTRTLALTSAVVVPLTAALAWFAWAVWAYRTTNVPASGLPFGEIGDGWAYAVLFDLGVLAAVGGPLVGLCLARWLHFRGAAAIAVVVLVLATIIMQGLFAPLRTVRLIMPWTYFGGPQGIQGDPNRMVIMVGSPVWYGAYVALLCVAGVLVAMLHDPEGDRRRLRWWLVVTLVLAAAATALAMTTGVQPEMINPVPSGVA